MENKQIKLSVRNLVEFIFRSGDIDSQFIRNSRALEGTKAHQKIQKSYLKSDYDSEIRLQHTVQYKNFSYQIEGRADGLFKTRTPLVIDEIKSTTRSLDDLPSGYELHWAQAKVYAYIYSLQNDLSEIGVQLTYFQLESEEIKTFVTYFSLDKLTDFFYDLLNKYQIWAELSSNWETKRNLTIKNLAFPFESYRNGQRPLAIAVYKTISQGKKSFIQAPTGIGKTISTLFPTIKSMAEGYCSKVFYLTAKTVIRGVAEEAFDKMAKNGLYIKSLTLTAKDKICFMDERICDPDHCPYAKGHFDRVNVAIIDLFNTENQFTRKVIEAYAQKYQVCPFEFSLDLTNFCDCIICDYNYVFDPKVSLKHFFSDSQQDYVFLIDEAHNLVDRAREMFSAELHKKTILDLMRIFKQVDSPIFKSLKKLNTFMLALKKNIPTGNNNILKSDPKELDPLLYQFIHSSEDWLSQNEGHPHHQNLLEFYFDALRFLRTGELVDERYLTYVETQFKNTRIKRFCLDPSHLLAETLKLSRASLFFSATLSPLGYFSELLGGDESTYHLKFPSPFESQNRAILVADRISTRYKDRDQTAGIIAQYLNELFNVHSGNYIAFFPSYQYMNSVYDTFISLFPSVPTLIQETTMAEEMRENFVKTFKSRPEGGLLGFCVLGGIFSEGIDLTLDALIGTAIIGVGLPQICFERDIIKNYFEAKNRHGFDYAYVFPGMNKVEQAAGRVIRTTQDKGVILLIDDRFSQARYQTLFPKEWFPHQKISSPDQLRQTLKNFWQK